MIPGTFAYHRPTTIGSAVALLIELGEDARPLAGGHSLIPLMKTRLASPEHLIDLAGIDGLSGIARSDDDIVIGAMTTQHSLIGSSLLSELAPIIRETSLMIADPQIRYKGTIGGNCANGDPGNDMPALMQCLNARYALTGNEGSREVLARDFYLGAYETALAAGEILTAVRIPVPAAGHGYAYEKLKRKVGDYATAAAAVMITMAGDTCMSVSIGLTNVAETPLWAEEAGRLLVGTKLDEGSVASAVAAAEAITDPASDMRGPADYRTKMAGVMLRRALERARSRATA
ncbi:carbon-monoxide dehydrogenase medium subunit [Rhizobium azooxidifex]|uniref:Carbon-monoxide dehydrogenase medium subunit n=1 Tax=Mycoplana azooxidifex TaxID=1636188 RepID=A0A7W6DAU2_9HYPH|nr:xanthine dehydrogenase family protein subunit M [Mycoplana azooxidifex]MBB3979808.1 carbon-monoxide dehydrogenase medium subunit [Mycoplana azooxidifex]